MANYPRYWTKFPRQGFDAARPARGATKDMAVKARQIEATYRAGHTGEPFVQLVEETADQYRVVAEWMPAQGCWDSHFGAAGFLPRSF